MMQKTKLLCKFELKTRTMRALVISILVFVPILAVLLWLNESHAGPIILGLYVVYMLASFKKVNAGEVAGLFLFGKSIKVIGQGLHLVPLGLYQIQKETSTLFNDELPAEPEKIFRGDGHPPVDSGLIPPIRILFGPPKEEDPNELKGNPYHQSMVTDVTPVVAWQITNFPRFKEMIGTVENCRRLLADLCVGIATREFANKTPAVANYTLETSNQNLKTTLDEELGGVVSWGIKIHAAYFKPLQFSHKLNSAVIDVPVSEQKALSYENEQEMIVKWKKKFLVDTGLAKIDKDGNITELVPDANVRISSEALKELAKLQGTLVLGDKGIQPFLNIQNQQ